MNGSRVRTLPIMRVLAMRIAVVIPAYRVGDQSWGSSLGSDLRSMPIYVVDDACPEDSGEIVEAGCDDLGFASSGGETNGGVGAAVKSGWRARPGGWLRYHGEGRRRWPDGPSAAACVRRPHHGRPGRLHEGQPLLRSGERAPDAADPTAWERGPLLHVEGIVGLLARLQPTNGYTAISAAALRLLPLDKIADRFFFESDVLFRLGTVRAVVKDIPMVAVYQDEPSSLSVSNVDRPVPVRPSAGLS